MALEVRKCGRKIDKAGNKGAELIKMKKRLCGRKYIRYNNYGKK